jgi:hypothetical protein
MALFSKKQSDTLSQYVDPTGELSSKEFRFGYWYLTHKKTLRNIGIGVLVAWIVVTLGISLFIIGQYAFFGYWQDKGMYNMQAVEFEDYTRLQPSYSPVGLVIESPFVYESSPGKYDIVSAVDNPNPRFVAHLEYHYVYDQGETAIQTAVLWPRTHHVLPALGIENTSFLSRTKMIIDTMRWEQIDAHDIFDIEPYIASHSNFLLDNIVIERQTVGSEVLVPEVRFDVTNDTIYHLWDAEMYVDVRRGNQTIAILPITMDNFMAGETRRITVRSFADITSATTMNLIPAFDVFDPDEFMSL